MISDSRLGMAIRRLNWNLLQIDIPEETLSAAITEEFQRVLAQTGVDVAMCDRTSLIAVLEYASGTSPDPDTQALINELTNDIALPE
ncbi:hypothetical protein [Nonomuraea typhae]|uniref:Uncharacterized protein n=1 Tax=Nonomuraea typhae TaxID=2603600 RepID=A0ABW7YM10_9ACTN